jgi:cell shape-determining protein MreC
MLLRISLIIAIIAALAAGAINFFVVKQKMETTEQHRASEEKAKQEAQGELANKKKDLEKTQKELEGTKTELATTKEEREKAQGEAAAAGKKVTELTAKLADATKDLGDARANLGAYEGTGYKPEQIVNFGKQLKQLQADFDGSVAENKILSKELEKTKAELARLQDPAWKPPVLPVGLKGKVLNADPKWNFVVLDVGEKQGVEKWGEMLVSRNGKLVAKVSVRSVEANRCVANVLPDWKLGEVMEGDAVISVQPPS